MLELDGRTRPVEVEHYWSHDGRPVFKFVGIDSISESELWQGADILVPEAERAGTGGRRVLARRSDWMQCCGRGRRRSIGVVTAVEDYGGPALLKVETADGREILVPFARSICREIDVAAKIIRVELPEGLLELLSAMIFHVLTIFPEFFRGPFEHGVIQRARQAGLIEITDSRSEGLDARPASDRG